jgi:hypothetical protein
VIGASLVEIAIGDEVRPVAWVAAGTAVVGVLIALGRPPAAPRRPLMTKHQCA